MTDTTIDLKTTVVIKRRLVPRLKPSAQISCRFSTDQVDEPAQAVLVVEELQHRPEGERNGKKHGGVADA